jgi:hypothetical protein
MWCQRPGVTQRKTVRPGRLHQHVSTQPQRRRTPPTPSASAARVPTARSRTAATDPTRIRRMNGSLATPPVGPSRPQPVSRITLGGHLSGAVLAAAGQAGSQRKPLLSSQMVASPSRLRLSCRRRAPTALVWGTEPSLGRERLESLADRRPRDRSAAAASRRPRLARRAADRRLAAPIRVPSLRFRHGGSTSSLALTFVQDS